MLPTISLKHPQFAHVLLYCINSYILHKKRISIFFQQEGRLSKNNLFCMDNNYVPITLRNFLFKQNVLICSVLRSTTNHLCILKNILQGRVTLAGGIFAMTVEDLYRALLHAKCKVIHSLKLSTAYICRYLEKCVRERVKKIQNVNFFQIGHDPPPLPPQNVNF